MSRNVRSLPGIGKITADELDRLCDIRNVDQLAKANPQEIARRTSRPLSRAEAWVRLAKEAEERLPASVHAGAAATAREASALPVTANEGGGKMGIVIFFVLLAGCVGTLWLADTDGTSGSSKKSADLNPPALAVQSSLPYCANTDDDPGEEFVLTLSFWDTVDTFSQEARSVRVAANGEIKILTTAGDYTRQSSPRWVEWSARNLQLHPQDSYWIDDDYGSRYTFAYGPKDVKPGDSYQFQVRFTLADGRVLEHVKEQWILCA